MRAVVTGGAGFIGSNIVDALVDAGVEVLIVDDLSRGRRTNLERALGLRRPSGGTGCSRRSRRRHDIPLLPPRAGVSPSCSDRRTRLDGRAGA
ncbi:MAG: NAD-dependent epimerase/dehydratase family protein [Pseudonocardiaceae bacterium]